MVNASKNKGDIGEREAVAYLLEIAPSALIVERPMRALGAGRKDDEGDIRVLRHATLQVKNFADVGAGLRESVKGALRQAANAGNPHKAGMVKVQRARPGSVRWLAAWSLEDPDWLAHPIEPVEFKQVGRALTWVRDDVGPYGYVARPRQDRVALLASGTTPLLFGPFEAWLERYTAAQNHASAAA